MMDITQANCKDLIIKKLNSLNVSKQNAKQVAEVLIEAELRNDPSHGISCLKKIISAIEKKEILPDKKPKIIFENNATAVIDGENILGPVSAVYAIDIAIQKAKQHGIAAVSIRKSHHLFTLGYYTKLAALNNMIGILTTATAPAIFAPNGLEKVLGTNPIAFGIPSNDKPIVIDMSSTNVARGKIRQAIKNNQEIPLDWALDDQGNPTKDPNKALEGSLQPLGGYKGFGLSLFIDIVSGILSNSACGKEISGTSMHVDSNKTAFKGDFMIIIDISKFLEVNQFKSRVSKLIAEIKNSKKIEQVKEIHIPGEKAYKNKDNSIEIDDSLYQELFD